MVLGSRSLVLGPVLSPALDEGPRTKNQGRSWLLSADGLRKNGSTHERCQLRGENRRGCTHAFQAFATVAHAARNSGTPFVVLKDRIVTKRMSLVAALRELKPDVDAEAEATRARNMARSDIAALSN